jgi:hypothetical protein
MKKFDSHRVPAHQLFGELTEDEKKQILMQAIEGIDSFFLASEANYWDEFIDLIVCSDMFADLDKDSRENLLDMLRELSSTTAIIGNILHDAECRIEERKENKAA